MPEAPITLEREPFAEIDDQRVERITLSNGRMRVRLLTYGGIIQSVEVPDRAGQLANVALGFAGLSDYVEHSPFFGATIGRFANRIARGQFMLDGVPYQLPINNGPNSLHGGPRGFHARLWQVAPVDIAGGVGVQLMLESPDGDAGFPGALSVKVTFSLDRSDALRLEYRATTDQPTVLNLTNHAYFNLAGEGSGSIEEHVLYAPSEQYTPIDATLIPTGEIASVVDTPFDFRTPRRIGERLRSGHPQLMLAHGYDHNLVVNRAHVFDDDVRLALAARVAHAASGRVLECWTTEPGVQFYTANFLDGSLQGSTARAYRQGDGFTLETQHYPDSPNHPAFPSTVLRPGQTFQSTTVYRFSITP